MPLNTIALSILIIACILLYVVFSKRGWNCTENGCVYVMGGSFSTYDQCNSVCKPNGNENNQNQVVSQLRNQSNDNVGLDTGMPHYVYVPPMPYYSYLPGPFYHDHHWYKRDKKHRESGGNKNHNENHIFINSPTGPNLN